MNKTGLLARLSQLDDWIRDDEQRITKQKDALLALKTAGGATTVAAGLLLHLERTRALRLAHRRLVVARLSQLSR